MTYLVALLATRWGSELGGINVFNTGLATAMPFVLTKHSRTLCFVQELPSHEVGVPAGVELRQLPRGAAELSEELQNVCCELEEKSLLAVLVVGHDVITGPLANECVQLLRKRLSNRFPVDDAIVSHMDYWEYAGKKGNSFDVVVRRHEEQKAAVLGADYAYAVGPLLTSNFSSARGVARGRTSPVRRLIPGAAEVRVKPFDERGGINFFISGRLNKGDDPIKNGILVVHALARAYDERRAVNNRQWRDRGRLIAYGVHKDDSELITELQSLGNENARFGIEPVEFSSDQLSMYERLADCHIALMPSWHEGFGLSGWEALCAGVPLLCSRQSGLATFLEELSANRPELTLHSVKFVSLSGPDASGVPSLHDIKVVSQALIEMVQDLPARKQAANSLARVLRAEFTWKRCASDLLDSVEGWYLPGSVHWSARQRFASDEVKKAKVTESREEVLDRILNRLSSLSIADDWQDLTTAFNYLSDLGESSMRIKRLDHLKQLREIGEAVGALVATPGDLPPLRDTGLLDVCWRYMAACSAISEDLSDFIGLLPDALRSIVWGDSFLAREMLHYVKRFAADLKRDDAWLSIPFFAPLTKLVSMHSTVAQRLARLASTTASYTKSVDGIEDNEAYVVEAGLCEAALRSAHDVGLEASKNPSLVATILAQMALGADSTRQVADQPRAFIKAYYPDTDKVQGYWRGDKRLDAALATANLPTSAILPALQSMSRDEDESIRWAALHLAFSPILRSRLEASVRAGALDLEAPLNQALGSVVDEAVRFESGHPWLCREFLSHFQIEWQSKAPLHPNHPQTNLTLFDFPIARSLFGPVIGETLSGLGGSQHPEVQFFRRAAQVRVRRVLLVLPPIESLEVGAIPASSTSTPPLGLGLLATHLSAQGHDVQVVDCHRFPELADDVVKLASTFDLIGFNTVFTTVKPVVRMLSEIRSRSARAILVVGGPAAKLHSWKQAAGSAGDAAQSWDFAISDNAEDNLTLLVNSLTLDTPWPETIGMEANLQSSALKYRDVASRSKLQRTGAESAWKEIVVDRRVFRSKGRQYEPAWTRSPTHQLHQAHVVMSQGCDWNCVFCTERAAVSGGERRRNVENVLSELEHLSRRYKDLNIQFIDDNLLPQIATINTDDVRRRVDSQVWAASFLNGLARIRSNSRGTFGWRGIFRLEDFFTYETAFGQAHFYDLLSSSGCRMLAFGIEQGDEQRRARVKAGASVISNEVISSLFARLVRYDILTKAYFILGGPWETGESAKATIDFAIASGATLAYFALYKDFTRAAQKLSRPHAGGDISGEAFLDYRQLAMNWDAAFTSEDSGSTEGAVSRSLSPPITDVERDCYTKLSALGFSFFDVVKYNDFHSEEGAAGELLNAATWSSPTEYFLLVEQAYRRFYLRPEFVTSYESLLAHGY